MDWRFEIARVLLSLIFVSAGFGKLGLWSFHQTVSAECGVPVPRVSVPLTVLMDLGGAACLIAGIFVWQASLVLAGYVALVTVFFYVPWGGSPHWWYEQMSQMFKNAALIGGLLLSALADPHLPGHW